MSHASICKCHHPMANHSRAGECDQCDCEDYLPRFAPEGM